MIGRMNKPLRFFTVAFVILLVASVWLSHIRGMAALDIALGHAIGLLGGVVLLVAIDSGLHQLEVRDPRVAITSLGPRLA